MQVAITAMVGLPGDLVRPRWQPSPPVQPAPEINWMAFGVTRVEGDDYPAIRHYGEGEGHDVLTRHQTITFLATIYGPNSNDLALLLRDNLYIPQNWEGITPTTGLKLRTVEAISQVPEWINNQYIGRADLEFSLRQQLDRTYPIFNLLDAAVDQHTEQCTTSLPSVLEPAVPFAAEDGAQFSLEDDSGVLVQEGTR
jgi:hypothetical protein